MKQHRPHLLVVFALAIVVLSGLSIGIQNMLTDQRFGWTPRAASGEIVLVAIDPKSIERIGVWPWPRSIHARLIETLEKAGAADIAFDVDFSTPSDAAADVAFAAALKAAGGSVVLPSFRQPIHAGKSGLLHINRPLPEFAAQSWSAVVNVTVEADGRVRRSPFAQIIDGRTLPSMASVLAGASNLSRPPFMIDYGIRAVTVPTVSYADVLGGTPEVLRQLNGKRVIIGGTALELGDRFSVPNGAVIAGPVLQVLAAESIAQQRALTSTSGVVTWSGVALIALLMMLVWRRFPAGRRVALLIALGVAIEAIAYLLQSRWPIVLETALFQTAIVAYLTAIALDEIDFRGLLSSIAEKRFERVTMSLGDGLVCAGPDFAITMWNPGAESIFGYRADEVIGRPFDTLCAHPASDNTFAPFSIRDLPEQSLQAAGGRVVEFEGRRKDGETFAIEACFSGWQGTDGFNYGASLRDISLRKQEAEKIRYLAEHDSVTGLPNRDALQVRLRAAMAEAQCHPHPISLLAISVDNLQQTNVMLGQAFGDLMLRTIGEHLKLELGIGAFVAHLTGHEFAVLADHADGVAAMALCRQCSAAFDRPLPVGGRSHKIDVSIGVVMLPDHAASIDEAFGNAHLALVRAKAERNGAVFYEASFRRDMESRLSTEADLVRALAEREFELFYQPQVSLADHRVIGAEALIRWRHPERGLIPPFQFMPIVHTSPISNAVARWVLHTACRQGAAWSEAGHRIRMGVNLSPSQFAEGDLADDVVTALAATGLPAAQLELEVTEDILLDDAARALAMFRRLRDQGVRVVFDDFGTGYASLSYLRKFPLDGLKIDRSFVSELVSSRTDAAIVGSTIDLARQLGLSVVAEGVEDRTTADMLAKLGCADAQGYYFGKPMPASEFAATFFAVERPDQSQARAVRAS